MSNKKNMCKRRDEFYCTRGQEHNCKYGKNTDVGECDYKEYIICHCPEAIAEAQKPAKRKPLADGTLELTESERIEFINLLVWHRFYDLESVKIVNDLLTIGRSNNGIHCDYIFSLSVKAIAYLLDKFELEV